MVHGIKIVFTIIALLWHPPTGRYGNCEPHVLGLLMWWFWDFLWFWCGWMLLKGVNLPFALLHYILPCCIWFLDTLSDWESFIDAFHNFLTPIFLSLSPLLLFLNVNKTQLSSESLRFLIMQWLHPQDESTSQSAASWASRHCHNDRQAGRRA